jgi:hypothetical protein
MADEARNQHLGAIFRGLHAGVGLKNRRACPGVFISNAISRQPILVRHMRLIGGDREAWRRATARQRFLGLALSLMISLPLVLLLIVLALLLANRL